MNCPKCFNRGFSPTPNFKKPIQNLGCKQHYLTFDTRRYICIQCGHKWMTKEEFYMNLDLDMRTKEFRSSDSNADKQNKTN